MNRKELPLRIITEEKIYTQEEAKELKSSRKYKNENADRVARYPNLSAFLMKTILGSIN